MLIRVQSFAQVEGKLSWNFAERYGQFTAFSNISVREFYMQQHTERLLSGEGDVATEIAHKLLNVTQIPTTGYRLPTNSDRKASCYRRAI